MNPKNIAKSATIPPLPSTSRPKSPPRSRPGISITTPTTTVTTQPPSRAGASSPPRKPSPPAIVLQNLARGTGSGSSSSGVTQFVDTRSAPSTDLWEERRLLSPRHQNTHHQPIAIKAGSGCWEDSTYQDCIINSHPEDTPQRLAYQPLTDKRTPVEIFLGSNDGQHFDH